MIRELLRPERILLGLRGEFPRVLEELLRRSSFPGRAGEVRAALLGQGPGPCLFVGDETAIPHARLEGLASPELILATCPEGLRLGERVARVIVLLVTPADQTAWHLQILQRLSSLLPLVAADLLGERDASRALKIVSRCEDQTGQATFINLTQDQVAFELQTDLARGLAAAEATRRLALHGPNLLRKTQRTPWYLGLLRNFFSFFAILLWIASLLCFIPGVDMPQLGIAILVVIVVNGLFAFLQEYRSDRAVEVLQKLLSPRCRVTRGGRTLEVDASTLVPGDVITLDEGDIVPADARLIEAFEVEVDNSTLTGESTSARRYKSDRPMLLSGRFLWIEMPNIVFAGTALVRGHARAVVFGTGMNSEVGKIAGLTQEIQAEESPLQKQLRGAVRAVTLLAGGLGLAFLLVGWLGAGLSFVQAFVFCIGMFVANVPEGLLPTVTLSLAMGVTRMARRNALVRSLPAVETLGCTTVICCDKTGTLTQNLMMVGELCVDGRIVRVSGTGYRPEGEFSLDERALSLEEISRWPALRRLLECAFVCNDARVEKSGADYRVVGDPTEGALMALAEKARIRGTHQRLHLNPFESVRKRMSVVVKLEGREGATVYAKGAPLEILARCERILWQGEVRPLDEEHRRRITAENDAMAREGLRVLALTFRDDLDPPAARVADPERGPYDAERVESGLIFLGLTGMSDPIRPGVPEAIRACRTAGIRVVMITGDYGLTAASIARQVGLCDQRAPRVVTGAEISDLRDEDLRALLARGEDLFARVSPEHKLRIVTLLKEMGEIVAVTGDGVNDAPALKKADIGIAMGLRGSDVAKEAADLILTDDNFSSIVAAIEEGRAIFDNIRRFAAYVLNSNPQEMYPYIFWMLFPGMPLAMTVMGVLAVDVGTDLIPAMGLGVEPPEKGIMERPPRRRDEKLLSLKFLLRSYFVQGSLLALSCYATYFYMGWVLGSMPPSPRGLRLEEASPAYLMTLTAYFFPTVTTQVANVLCKRSRKTSLFSRDFLSPARRGEILQALAGWRPRRYTHRVRMDYVVSEVGHVETAKAFGALVSGALLFPLRMLVVVLSKAGALLERPLIAPLTARAARFFDRHPVLLNLVSNPVIDLGIVFELLLCYLFFYTPLSRIYYFAPVPWHVYLFAFHGTVLLLAFEEVKKYFRRRGLPLDFLG